MYTICVLALIAIPASRYVKKAFPEVSSRVTSQVTSYVKKTIKKIAIAIKLKKSPDEKQEKAGQKKTVQPETMSLTYAQIKVDRMILENRIAKDKRKIVFDEIMTEVKKRAVQRKIKRRDLQEIAHAVFKRHK